MARPEREPGASQVEAKDSGFRQRVTSRKGLAWQMALCPENLLQQVVAWAAEDGQSQS